MGELKECGWKKADEKKEAEVGETKLKNDGKKRKLWLQNISNMHGHVIVVMKRPCCTIKIMI